ncbi:hypothetical protein Sfulv_58820 [Streptomyces fulvorobeus]|uniref:Uncharacterized protein n=1 Tax=Streptomyces fulvorobeus TaxID=284028 RepID=A0A7J0CF10_9ACTN|nr:hypothetical protein Sfulv_58820 [Streptomyces fulvorobeus]
MLGISQSDLPRLTAVPLHADTEIASLVIPFLIRLATQAGTQPPHLTDLLTRNATDGHRSPLRFHQPAPLQPRVPRRLRHIPRDWRAAACAVTPTGHPHAYKA